MKRITVNSVTDALIQATEHAGEIKHILILYETKEGVEYEHGMFTDGETTLACMNYMLDLAKTWIFSPDEDGT